MKIDVGQISSVIKDEIEKYQISVDTEDVGTVIEAGDGIANIYGLKSLMASEMVQFENGVYGLALNLEEDSVGVVILGEHLDITEGMSVKRTGRLLSVPVGKQLIGRVINPLGQALDGKEALSFDETRPMEIIAPGIAKRQPVKVPLQTGIKAIDSMIPIGRGQRELIIGDRKTGKTAICIDTIINQRGQNVICVYVAIGQKSSSIAGIVERLQAEGAMDWTIIVNASASDPAPLQYLAPYAGCAMAEYFMYSEHKDTLVIYDDLSKQANAYRQLSLLLERPPGREAYPGDIFYLHSRLLERSCKLNDSLGAGSLTALPIVETQEGEVSAYIPTNVISITDGQIYLTPQLFASGVRPALDVGISVSRVGGNAQIKAMKKVAGSLRLELSQFRELEAFAQLGTEVDKSTQRQLDRGYRLVEILKQKQFQPMSVENQVSIIFAAINGYLDKIPIDMVTKCEEEFHKYMNTTGKEILKKIAAEKEIKNEEELKKCIADFMETFTKQNNL